MLNQLCLQSYFILQWQDARSPLKHSPHLTHSLNKQYLSSKIQSSKSCKKKTSSLVSTLNPFMCFSSTKGPKKSSKIIRARRPVLEVSQFGEAARKTVEEEVANFLAQGSDPSGSPVWRGAVGILLGEVLWNDC